MIEYTKNFSYTKIFAKSSNPLAQLGKSKSAKGLNTALGIAGAGIGLVAGGIGLKKQLSDNSKFAVVFDTANGPKKLNVSAPDKIAARNKAQSQFNGVDYKVFYLPQEDDMAMDYYESLERRHQN